MPVITGDRVEMDYGAYTRLIAARDDWRTTARDLRKQIASERVLTQSLEKQVESEKARTIQLIEPILVICRCLCDEIERLKTERAGAEIQGGWISVDNWLPRSFGNYRVTDDIDIWTATFSWKRQRWLGHHNIKRWRPLPGEIYLMNDPNVTRER